MIYSVQHMCWINVVITETQGILRMRVGDTEIKSKIQQNYIFCMSLIQTSVVRQLAQMFPAVHKFRSSLWVVDPGDLQQYELADNVIHAVYWQENSHLIYAFRFCKMLSFIWSESLAKEYVEKFRWNHGEKFAFPVECPVEFRGSQACPVSRFLSGWPSWNTQYGLHRNLLSPSTGLQAPIHLQWDLLG